MNPLEVIAIIWVTVDLLIITLVAVTNLNTKKESRKCIKR